MNIYDTRITVYRGVNYNPDGTPVPWHFCTADFPSYEDGGYFDGGEYIFDVDENDNLYPVSTVGNVEEWTAVEVYENYCVMMVAVCGKSRKSHSG